jgi:HSP20 family protein
MVAPPRPDPAPPPAPPPGPVPTPDPAPFPGPTNPLPGPMGPIVAPSDQLATAGAACHWRRLLVVRQWQPGRNRICKPIFAEMFPKNLDSRYVRLENFRETNKQPGAYHQSQFLWGESSGARLGRLGKEATTMANLVRWDPLSEFTPLRQMMDRLMEDAWVRPHNSWIPGNAEGFGHFAFDLYETDDDFIVTAALPGVKPEDVDLSVQGNVLTISGELKPEEHGGEQRNYHTRERRYGKFSRQVALPTGINGDQIQARLDNGVLTLHVPKAEEQKPRRVQISGGTGTTSRPMIEGEQRAA